MVATMAASGSESFVAFYDLNLDANTLDGSVSERLTRGGAVTQSTVIDALDSAIPFKFRLAVERVSRTPDGDVQVLLRHQHPLPAPNITTPPGASNRADLGYTGRLVVFTDFPSNERSSHTYFGDVMAQTDAVRFADGYVRPGGTVALTGLAANTFPYMLLVDEAKDNRIGVSNEGVMTGNSDYAIKGWQRANLGATGDGWTGYDYLHAGQSSEITLRFDGRTLDAASVAVSLGLLIRYTEPKALAQKPLWLPPKNLDSPPEFAYRLPHAALDCSVIALVITSEGPVQSQTDVIGLGSGVSTRLQVRDWDAGAAESDAASLDVDPFVTTIMPGTGARPEVLLDCPALLSDPVALNFRDGSGSPGEELEYAWPGLPNDGESAQRYTGMVRVEDAEMRVADTGPHLGLNPMTHELSAAARVLPITYQAIHFQTHKTRTWEGISLIPAQENRVPDSDLALHPGSEGGAYDDRAMVAYWTNDLPSDGDNATLIFGRATIWRPKNPANWQMMTLIDDEQAGGQQVAMVVRDQLPALVVERTAPVRGLYLVQALIPEPDSAADWRITPIWEPASCSSPMLVNSLELTVSPTGEWVVLITSYCAGALQCFQSTVADPMGTADWEGHSVLQSITGKESFGGVVWVQNRMLLGYPRPDESDPLIRRPWVAWAMMTRPAGPGDWAHAPVSAEPLEGRQITLAVSGTDVFATGGDWIAEDFSMGQTPMAFRCTTGSLMEATASVDLTFGESGPVRAWVNAPGGFDPSRVPGISLSAQRHPRSLGEWSSHSFPMATSSEVGPIDCVTSDKYTFLLNWNEESGLTFWTGS
ncbi:MAG: hypothetical protein ABI743_04910 [bacterium]